MEGRTVPGEVWSTEMTPEQIFLYGAIALMILISLRKQFLARSLNNYSGSEAKQRVKSGSLLLDVRTPAERGSISIPSSLHIPLHELSGRIHELEKYRGKEIICFCASGSRSVSAGIKLKKAGFTAGNLKGGIAAWNF